MSSLISKIGFNSAPIISSSKQETPAVRDLTKALENAHNQAKVIENLTKSVLSITAVALLILGILAWSPLFLSIGAGLYIFSDFLCGVVLKHMSNNLEKLCHSN